MTESFALSLGAVSVGGLAFAAAVAAGLHRHNIPIIFGGLSVAAFVIGFLM